MQPLALMLCHRITEHSGCIKQLVLSPAQLPWLLLQHVSQQDHALDMQMESAACVYIHDPINKNLLMKIGPVTYFGLGQCPHLLLQCRVGLQSLATGKGCPFWAKTLPLSCTVLTAAACKELQSSHSTPPVGKAPSAGGEGCPAACLPNEKNAFMLFAGRCKDITYLSIGDCNQLSGSSFSTISSTAGV